MRKLIAFLLTAGAIGAQVVTINSSDNGAVSLGKINANFALLAPKANSVFSGSFTITGFGSGVPKFTSGVLGLVSGTSTFCVHVDGSSAACTTGSVTSVGLSGTANQITVTGATPITSSGAWVLSFPTNMTLPGTTTGTFSGNLTGAVTGNASTATALAANPANCSAGNLPRGVDASGVAEGCAPASLTADVTGSLPTANMAAAALVRPCEIVIGDPGTTSPTLANDNDTPAVCVNDSAATMTITAVKCYADAGSPTVTPIITGAGGTSILSGALTCGNGSYASGTLNGTPTETAGQTVDGNITVAGGTAKYIVIRISRTL